ncbi:hypothetical protein [Methylobacterium sp. Leaf112]|uniref:hypothetical protein n=1 Tax=Methylobacterium sp. Leaf112 TaxID=1736258 RepID=UPI0006FB9CAB|nr:hypothetical protein [Methylobacterium sp. Leaf112]KQP62784.1 hypothetical protein ASF52_21130 [Methylobacterium sp. Leaf112]
MEKGISLSELARQLGRAKSGLHKLAAKGQIPQRDDGKFDLEAVRLALVSNTDPSRQGEAFAGGHQPVNGERLARTVEPAPDVAAQASVEAQLAVTRIREILLAEGVGVDGPLTFNHARTAEKIVQTWQRDQAHAEAKGKVVDAETAGRRWADEIVKLGARMLAIPGDCALELSHLTKHEVSVIDRIVRDAMDQAAGDGPP